MISAQNMAAVLFLDIYRDTVHLRVVLNWGTIDTLHLFFPHSQSLGVTLHE